MTEGVIAVKTRAVKTHMHRWCAPWASNVLYDVMQTLCTTVKYIAFFLIAKCILKGSVAYFESIYNIIYNNYSRISK